MPTTLPNRLRSRRRSEFLGLKTLSCFAAAALLTLATRASAAEIQPLKESTLIEIINEVKILQGESLEAVEAETEMVFRAPDFLETGRRSRARMQADDGTITRVGSNTLFAFDEASRTINLKNGSLLFHSPEGMGGGRIITASATASVVGTTIITVATADGGFKVLVLEGTAQVAFPDGTIRILTAGQMTFVLPGDGINSSQAQDSSKEGEKKSSKGKPGPVLNFDLSKLTQDSNLINGFGDKLPSQAKIDQATQTQLDQIANGEFDSTDALIISTDGDNVVLNLFDGRNLVTSSQDNTNSIDSGMPSGNTGNTGGGGASGGVNTFANDQERLFAAVRTPVSVGENGFETDNIFSDPIIPDSGTFPVESALAPDEPAFGFIAEEITFTGGSHDVSPITIPNPDPEIEDALTFIGAPQAVRFSGDNVFNGFEEDTAVEIASFAGVIFDEDASLTIASITEGSNDSADSSDSDLSVSLDAVAAPKNSLIMGDSESPIFSPVSPTLPFNIDLNINTDGPINLGGGNLYNPYGSILLESDTYIRSSGEIYAGHYDSGSYIVNLARSPQASPKFSGTFNESNSPSFGSIMLLTGGDIQLEGADVDAAGMVEISASGTVDIGGSDYYSTTYIYGEEVLIEGDEGVSIQYSSIETGTDDIGYGGADASIETIKIASYEGGVDLQSGANVNSDSVVIEGRDGVSLANASIDTTSDYYGDYYSPTSIPKNGDDSAPDDLIISTSNGNISINDSSNLYGETISLSAQTGEISITEESTYISADDLLRITGNTTVQIDAAQISASYIEIRANEVRIAGEGVNTRTISEYVSNPELEIYADTLAELSSIDLSNLTNVNVEGQTLNFSDVTFPNHGNVFLKSSKGLLNVGTSMLGYVNFEPGKVWVKGESLNAEHFVNQAFGGLATSPEDYLIQIGKTGPEIEE